jgi:hypothetical protein
MDFTRELKTFVTAGEPPMGLSAHSLIAKGRSRRRWRFSIGAGGASAATALALTGMMGGLAPSSGMSIADGGCPSLPLRGGVSGTPAAPDRPVQVPGTPGPVEPGPSYVISPHASLLPSDLATPGASISAYAYTPASPPGSTASPGAGTPGPGTPGSSSPDSGSPDPSKTGQPGATPQAGGSPGGALNYASPTPMPTGTFGPPYAAEPSPSPRGEVPIEELYCHLTTYLLRVLPGTTYLATAGAEPLKPVAVGPEFYFASTLAHLPDGRSIMISIMIQANTGQPSQRQSAESTEVFTGASHVRVELSSGVLSPEQVLELVTAPELDLFR